MGTEVIHANIDADIFTYSFGSCTDAFGHPLAWPLVATRLNAQIRNIRDAVGADTYQLYITGTTNFRPAIATIRPYKGNRPKAKPHWYEAIRRYLVSFRNARVIERWEADDQLAMDQTDNTVLCSIDKDLNIVPGLHYNWLHDELYTLTETDGLRNFYCQLLTGDTIDNILGLHGVGSKSTHCAFVRECDSEHDMYGRVRKEYTKRYGAYWRGFLEENAQLLWMVRNERPDPENEIIERLGELTDRYEGQNWKTMLLAS